MLFVTPFNVVSKWDNEHILETLENTINDGNQTEEVVTNFSVGVVDAQMSAVMNEWFSHLQKTFENTFSSILQSFAQKNIFYALPPNLHVPSHASPSEMNTLAFFLLKQR